MPEFFIELFSEEIPARMQAKAGLQLKDICAEILAALSPSEIKVFYGPRRIAFSAMIAAEKPGSQLEMRGPRDSAPEAALTGFLSKYAATPKDVVKEGGYYVLRQALPPQKAETLIGETLARALAKFSWPKSMRWGQSGDFTWVRPLRRIICLLDGEIIPITLGPVTASNETQGHRVMAPSTFRVASAAIWEEQLREHKVIADPTERRNLIQQGVAAKAAALNLLVVEDPALLDEVTGLAEYPVPLIGQIDDAFMSLPPELRELSMKENQKYFTLRHQDGSPAPYFAFVADLLAPDGGAAIIAGNERVLRARLSDARHFWDLDHKTQLAGLLPKLGKITFHAKIGTQLERANRLAANAAAIAMALGGSKADCEHASQAGLLCKADLVTSMVGEFPELQGIIGGYLAAAEGQAAVGAAISKHYQPKGASDDVPRGVVPASTALADRLDTLTKFFAIGEVPTGSGDPFALRRAALGVIRIILENQLRLNLKPLIKGDENLFSFIIERLRVKLRGEGQRFDVLDSVLSAGTDDDLVRIMGRVDTLRALLATPDGANLKSSFDRANNILQKEETKDGTSYHQNYDKSLLQEPAEQRLAGDIEAIGSRTNALIAQDHFAEAMAQFASLRPAIDQFFTDVTVNTNEPKIRHNRLQLLSQFIDCVNQIADFSKIEG